MTLVGPMLGREIALLPQEGVHENPSLNAVVGVVIAVSLSWGAPALGHDADEQQLGTVHFPTSCSQPAQQQFDRAMRYQHSFWYRVAREAFEQVLQADPECAMAYWGIALASS